MSFANSHADARSPAGSAEWHPHSEIPAGASRWAYCRANCPGRTDPETKGGLAHKIGGRFAVRDVEWYQAMPDRVGVVRRPSGDPLESSWIQPDSLSNLYSFAMEIAQSRFKLFFGQAAEGYEHGRHTLDTGTRLR